MTFGQDLDAMIEARNAREWEQLNQGKEIDSDRIILCLGDAWGNISDAVGLLEEGRDEAEGTRFWAKTQSVIDQLEELKNEIHNIQKEVKRA